MFLDSLVIMSPESLVGMFQEPVVSLFHPRSVEMFLVKFVRMLTGKSAATPHPSNAKKCQDKVVQVNLKDNAKVFQEDLAEPSHKNHASRCHKDNAAQHREKFVKTSLRENAKKLAKMFTGVRFATPGVDTDIDHPDHQIPRNVSRKSLNRQTD